MARKTADKIVVKLVKALSYRNDEISLRKGEQAEVPASSRDYYINTGLFEIQELAVKTDDVNEVENKTVNEKVAEEPAKDTKK